MSSRERMSAVDAAWLHMDRPTNLMVMHLVGWFDEPLDWDVVTKRIQSRWIERYPRFRQRVTEGWLPFRGPYWEDDPRFALENHLHHIALPAPGDQEALQTFVSDKMGVPIDKAKPLWHVYFVDGYGSGCAILVRMHHAVADGMALTQVLLASTDDADDVAHVDDEPPGPRGWTGVLDTLTRPARGAAGTAWRTTGSVLTQGRALVAHPNRIGELTATGLDLAATGRDDAVIVAKLVFTPPAARTAVTGQTGIAKRAVWSSPIPLADVKAVGEATGTTVNDVMVAAVTGALRRYLQTHGTLVDNLRTFVPFNLRPLDRPVPVTLGNRFGLVFLDLPVGLDDPITRLREVSRRMTAIKNSQEGVVGFGMLSGVGHSPTQVHKALVDFFTAKASAVITNVPCPRTPVYVGGVPLAGVMAWVPRSGNTPMGACIFSYAEKVYVGIAVDAGLVPEPQTIVAAFRAELDELLRLAGA